MALPALNTPDLKAELGIQPDSLRLTFNGRAETPETRENLRIFFAAVDRTLFEHGAPKVVVDFGGLSFINSSCFKELVVWLTTVADRPPDKQYRFVFISNPAVRWQRASLHSLATFASHLVEIA